MILSDHDRQQLVEVFLAEAEETLARLEDLLLRLEQTPGDSELLHEIFRAAHTLKGNASCLQFDALTTSAHTVEGILDRLRSGELQATATRISQLLNAVDVLRDLSVRSIGGDCALTTRQEAVLAELTECSTEAAGTPPDVAGHEGGRIAAAQARSTHSLRVDIEKLDRMLNLTGEIAITRGRIYELISAQQGRERVLDAMHELDRLSLDLQELVMDARLVPVGPSLRHFHRVVRDLAAAASKRVNLVIEGNEVEVDTTVIEHLKDPITHMIRNAIDHGIEMPDERTAMGKPASGTVRITAAHESGAVVFRVADDGRGLNEADIVRRAHALEIETDRLSRQEILNLIFRPGFSTASKVTEISGRGVGMDVVQRNVEALRGSVTVTSEPGAGTTFTLRLPLTVALIEGFGVGVGDETYVIPIDAILECLELPVGSTRDARGVLDLRGSPVPFVRLRGLFDLPAAAPARENVVVVEVESGRAGIVVDELLGGNQTVMKPMSRFLHATGVTGSSILGNGRVALILDPEEIVRRAELAA